MDVYFAFPQFEAGRGEYVKFMGGDALENQQSCDDLVSQGYLLA